MLSIRFARVGKTKQPTYRLTVAEKGRDAYGRSLEILGHYNPRSKVCEVNAERIKYWISVGAQPSPRVHNLLVDQNVITTPKIKISRAKKKKGAEAAPAAEKKTPATEGKKEAAKEEKKEPAAKDEKKESAPKKEEKPAPEAKK